MTALADPRFEAAGIHVWVLATDDSDRRDTERWLDADEAARAQRYTLDMPRREFSATRAALRLLLGGYLGCAPSAVRFTAAARGKPLLAGPAALHFNVSHSGGVALLAVSAQHAVGVDVELTRPLPDLAALAQRVFDAADAARWRALPAADRLAAFYRAWTRKEACVKASGDGLWADLAGLHVDLDRTPLGAAHTEAGDRWTVHDLALPAHAAAVAWAGAAAIGVSVRRLDQATWAQLAQR